MKSRNWLLLAACAATAWVTYKYYRKRQCILHDDTESSLPSTESSREEEPTLKSIQLHLESQDRAIKRSDCITFIAFSGSIVFLGVALWLGSMTNITIIDYLFLIVVGLALALIGCWKLVNTKLKDNSTTHHNDIKNSWSFTELISVAESNSRTRRYKRICIILSIGLSLLIIGLILYYRWVSDISPLNCLLIGISLFLLYGTLLHFSGSSIDLELINTIALQQDKLNIDFYIDLIKKKFRAKVGLGLIIFAIISEGLAILVSAVLHQLELGGF